MILISLPHPKAVNFEKILNKLLALLVVDLKYEMGVRFLSPLQCFLTFSNSFSPGLAEFDILEK